MLAAAFFVTSLGLAYLASSQADSAPDVGIPDAEVIEQQKTVPTLDDSSNQQDNAAPALEEEGQ